jgi:MFS family permease
MGFGVLRFALSAFDDRAGLLAGVALHGCSFTLVFITAQIYLDQRVDTAWRARAQALMSLMNSGVGNLIGYLGTGWWFAACARPAGTQWPLFWGVLAAAVGGVLVYFLAAYQGQGVGIKRTKESKT